MILKTAASIAAAALVVSQPADLVATFKHRVMPTGVVAFDLRIPASSWLLFSHGEPLDLEHQAFGPHTRKLVHELIDAGTALAHICRDGWVMGRPSIDEEGTRHFRGVCVAESAST